MRILKRFAAVIVCMALSTALYPTWEALGAEALSTSFELNDITAPTLANQGVDSAYRHNGTGNKAVYYYGYLRRPTALTGEPFTECFPYMCYGTGSRITELNHNLLSFNFDTPSNPIGINDVVYLSFYYRSASKFTGMDGNTYTGKTQTPSVRLNSKEIAMSELSSGSTTLSAFEADDQWHKVEYYLPITKELYEDTFGGSINLLQLRISFLSLDLAAYIELAGMRYGIMKTGGAEITNRMAYTYLGWNLRKGELNTLTVDGEAVALKSGINEYTVHADTTNPNIQATQSAGVACMPEITESGILEYEIKAYGKGYDSRLADDAQRSYLQCVDENGAFSESGTEQAYTVLNSEHYSVVLLHLSVNLVETALKLNGAAYDGTAVLKGGDSIVIEETFKNIKGVGTSYMTLLVFYNGESIVEVIPYKNTVGAAETSVAASHTYTLPNGDYSGRSVDLFIIDMSTMSDVLK